MKLSILVVTLGLALLVGCGSSVDDSGGFTPELRPLPADPADYAPLAGYDVMAVPADNPLTAEKVALGRQLYHDRRLSGDGSVSCYDCHQCELGLTDGRATAIGAFGKDIGRSAPTMWNVGFHWAFYWDGRADSLEAQAMAAWTGGNMGADAEAVCKELDGIPGYHEQFHAVFDDHVTPELVTKALASYVRTIVGGNTPYDRWQAGDESAVSDAAKRGHDVFTQAGCSECHTGVLFTDMIFHNVGIGWSEADRSFADIGRGKKTGEDADQAAFKTPTLRDILQSGPYFHDGSVATLEEAVRLMLDGGIDNPNKDAKLLKRDVTDAQVADLLAFLESLDEECDQPAPSLP